MRRLPTRVIEGVAVAVRLVAGHLSDGRENAHRSGKDHAGSGERPRGRSAVIGVFSVKHICLYIFYYFDVILDTDAPVRASVIAEVASNGPIDPFRDPSLMERRRSFAGARWSIGSTRLTVYLDVPRGDVIAVRPVIGRLAGRERPWPHFLYSDRLVLPGWPWTMTAVPGDETIPERSEPNSQQT